MPKEKGREGVLFVMSRDAQTSTGPMSMWLLASEWARAAERVYGESWLLTPSGVLTPEEASSMAVSAPKEGHARSKWKRILPLFLGTLRSDFRAWRGARQHLGEALEGPWEGASIPWVWQYHSLFVESGLHAGAHFNSPVVVFVDAPVVWEAKQWGTKRPGWGWATQKWGELDKLKRADVVACVSQEVAEQLAQLGISQERLIVTPNAVDVTRFNPQRATNSKVRESLQIAENDVVIGWVGTFHSFHGLDMLLEAFSEVSREHPNIRLLLVGDGQQRPEIGRRAAELGLSDLLLMPGAVPHTEMPGYIGAMDICVLVDPGHSTFHYSPMKLQEYLACGRAVIAPKSGEMARLLRHGKEALLVTPGDKTALSTAILGLVRDSSSRDQLAKAAADFSEKAHTWDNNVIKIHEKLAQGT